MKKIFAIGFLFIASLAYSQTAVLPVYYCAQNGVQAVTSGLKSSNYLQGVIPYCTVKIYLTGTTTIATTTPQTPLTANANGSIPPIYATTGVGYDVVFSGGFAPNTYATPVTLTGVMVGGSGGGGGTTTNALTAAASGGAAPGSAFNGSAALTWDYHTVGADASGAAAARQANLSLAPGTYVNGDMCTYASSGTLLNCNTAVPSVGTWGALNYPTWVSGTPFVKMTAAGTFSLDTNTYLTSSGVSGMTAGQLPIAATANTITSSIGYATAATASTIVERDSSNNINATTFTGALTGHASLDAALAGAAFTGPVSTTSTWAVGVSLPSGAPNGTSIDYCQTSIEGEANVVCYGADPTGVLYSDAAFQTLASMFVTVLIPDGHYKFAQHISPGAGQEWRGLGKRNSVLTYIPTTDTDAAFDIASVNNVHLHDFEIIAPNANGGVRLSTSGDCLTTPFPHTDYNTLERLYISSTSGRPSTPGADAGILLDGSISSGQRCIYYNRIYDNEIDGFSNAVTLGAGGASTQILPTGSNGTFARNNILSNFWNGYLVQSSQNDIRGGFVNSSGTSSHTAIGYNVPAIAGQNYIEFAVGGEMGAYSEAYLFGSGGNAGYGNAYLYAPNGVYQTVGVDNSPTVNSKVVFVNGQNEAVLASLTVTGGSTFGRTTNINYGGTTYGYLGTYSNIIGSGGFNPTLWSAGLPIVLGGADVLIGTATDCGQPLCVNGELSSAGTYFSNNISGQLNLLAPAGVALGSSSISLPLPVNTGEHIPQVVVSGTTALATSSISSGQCQTVTPGAVNSSAATGVATTDVIQFGANGSIKAVIGYVPSTSGGLTITSYPTAGYVNFDVCNWTDGNITPGAVTMNWMVTR